MITQVSIKNFKCLREVTVNLEPFTVFVGGNGSGKTSFLQAIDLICRTFRGDSDGKLEGEYQQNRSFGATEAVELSCQAGQILFRYRTEKNQPTEPVHLNGHTWSGQGAAFSLEGSSQDWQVWQRHDPWLPIPVWLRLDLNTLRNPTPAHAADPRIMLPTGQGLHAATAAMNLEDPDLWQKLQEDLRRIIPGIKRLRHTPQYELLFDTINGKGLKAHQMSEGTLFTLGLLTAIHRMNSPGILLLDDLDRALHPTGQWKLIELLQDIQSKNKDIQIAATTHSPYLLDRVRLEEVRVTGLRADGSTVCEPLTIHPQFGKWKDELHPGEMWTIFGEKWLTEMEVATK